MTNTPINTTKPLVLSDGTKVTYSGRSTLCGFRIRVSLPDGNYAYFSDVGNPYSGSRKLRNLPDAVALFAGKKLTTRSGTPAEFVIVHEGRAIFKLSYFGGAAGFVERNPDGTVFGGTTALGTTRSDPDDIVEVLPHVTTFRNVYADGTIGETAHKTPTAAVNGIKSGKVRIGVLHQTHQGSELISAQVQALSPSRRDGGVAFPWA